MGRSPWRLGPIQDSKEGLDHVDDAVLAVDYGNDSPSIEGEAGMRDVEGDHVADMLRSSRSRFQSSCATFSGCTSSSRYPRPLFWREIRRACCATINLSSFDKSTSEGWGHGCTYISISSNSKEFLLNTPSICSVSSLGSAVPSSMLFKLRIPATLASTVANG